MASLFLKDLTEIDKIGKKRSELFLKLGVSNIKDLLYNFPKSYLDFSNILKIRDAPCDKFCCIRATVCTKAKINKISEKKNTYKFKVCDSSGVLGITFFNNPHIVKFLPVGYEFLFFGKINNFFGNLSMICPKIFKLCESGKIIPIYKQVEMLPSKTIQAAVQSVIKNLPEKMQDAIPYTVRKKYKLCSFKFAVCNIHTPKITNDIYESKKYFAFEKALVLWLKLGKSNIKNDSNNHIIKESFSSEFSKSLDFELTKAQKRCIASCESDMQSENKSMSRLLQGDVGSGKTVVAASICYNCFRNNFQAAVMVPTEILSFQHLESFKKFFKNTSANIKVLTSSTTRKEKKEILNDLKDGKINILIGTHAILSDCVIFKNLGLVVVDEQHRFGVSQRASLSNKKGNPHVLIMTATPIPRTLALTFYNSLDVSLLDEVPRGRKNVDTFLINGKKREDCFSFVKNLIDKGQQGYIVCPLVEDNETDLMSASFYLKYTISSLFKNYNIALLHGRMKDEEKKAIINNFVNKKIHLLISTTVIEVGIDVKNASFIIIENAERFGLFTLHQLRGRVGRTDIKSYCILISDTKNENSLKRLTYFKSTLNGFLLAKEDLKTRGPGEFWSQRQHGFSGLEALTFFNNMDILSKTREASFRILKEDPELLKEEHKILKSKLLELGEISA